MVGPGSGGGIVVVMGGAVVVGIVVGIAVVVGIGMVGSMGGIVADPPVPVRGTPLHAHAEKPVPSAEQVCIAIVPSVHAQDKVVPGVQSVAVSVPVSSAAEQPPPSASTASGSKKRQAAPSFAIMGP